MLLTNAQKMRPLLQLQKWLELELELNCTILWVLRFHYRKEKYIEADCEWQMVENSFTNSKNRFQKNRNVLRNWCHLLMKIVLLQYDVSVLAYRCDLLFIDFPRCAAWNIFLFHIPTEWRMNASMLFIIAFVKFGNFSFKIEKKYISMCEIGSLSELVEWSIQNKRKKNTEKNNRRLCVGRSEHVSKARERERAARLARQ